MLKTFLLATGDSAPPPAYVGTTIVTQGGTYSSITFSNVDLGAHPTKIISIPMSLGCTISPTPFPFVSSATIAGVPATVYRTTNGASWQVTVMLVAQNISASTGDIVITFNRTVNVFSGALPSFYASVYSTERNTSFAFAHAGTDGGSTAISVTANAANNPDCLVIAGTSQSAVNGSMTGTGPGITIDASGNFNAYVNNPNDSWRASGSQLAATGSFTVSIPTGNFRSLACLTVV